MMRPPCCRLAQPPPGIIEIIIAGWYMHQPARE
jgi:hypothetical protein